jgi:hypothetical protein
VALFTLLIRFGLYPPLFADYTVMGVEKPISPARGVFINE